MRQTRSPRFRPDTEPTVARFDGGRCLLCGQPLFGGQYIVRVNQRTWNHLACATAAPPVGDDD